MARPLTNVGHLTYDAGMSTNVSPQTLIPEWTLGWRMQRALAHAGISVQQMADELGVARSTISRWVNDHGTPPRAVYVKMWAMRCGVPHEWLATGQAPAFHPDGDGGGTTSDLEKSSTEWYAGGDLAPVVHLTQSARAA